MRPPRFRFRGNPPWERYVGVNLFQGLRRKQFLSGIKQTIHVHCLRLGAILPALYQPQDHTNPENSRGEIHRQSRVSRKQNQRHDSRHHKDDANRFGATKFLPIAA
jgi:hypothetical protein